MKQRGRVRHDAGRVLLEVDGKLIADMDWQAALNLSALIRSAGKEAEEYCHANRIIGDQALLQRLGVNMGLTSNPAILAEAGKEAAHNRDLRRYLPGGVRSQEQFGRPVLTIVRATK